MSYLNPRPQDGDRPSGFFDRGGNNDGGRHDATAIRPFLPFAYGMARGVLNYFYPSYMGLDGPHFRVGRQVYNGVQYGAPMQSAECDVVIGMPTIIRPPRIPVRGASPQSVRNALIFVQSQPGMQPWQPVIPPPISLR